MNVFGNGCVPNEGDMRKLRERADQSVARRSYKPLYRVSRRSSAEWCSTTTPGQDITPPLIVLTYSCHNTYIPEVDTRTRRSKCSTSHLQAALEGLETMISRVVLDYYSRPGYNAASHHSVNIFMSQYGVRVASTYIPEVDTRTRRSKCSTSQLQAALEGLETMISRVVLDYYSRPGYNAASHHSVNIFMSQVGVRVASSYIPEVDDMRKLRERADQSVARRSYQLL
ncbi:hypothetical protein J6590_065038 [Homalodisca vitripennis]|nr:hypothetical protein J6590_065038 [Homalodisca vitripennis]